MNKFLSIIVFAALLYAPQVYAGGVVNTVVNAIVDAVDAVVNFVVDMVVIIVDMVVIAVTTVVGGTIDLVCNAAGGDCNLADQWSDPFMDDISCRDPFAGPGETKLIKAGCGGDGGVTGGGLENMPGIRPGTFTTTAFSSALSTCTGITLSGINAQGHNYAIMRSEGSGYYTTDEEGEEIFIEPESAMVAQLSSSEASYIDKNLKPHTNYTYKVRIPYPAESGYQTTDSAPIAAYTRCLPSCGFGVISSSVAKYGTSELRWKCNYNDPAADKGTCRISDSLGTVSKTVDALSGSLGIKVDENNQYTLQCANVDGTIAIPQSVTVFVPGVKEVKP